MLFEKRGLGGLEKRLGGLNLPANIALKTIYYIFLSYNSKKTPKHNFFTHKSNYYTTK
jgi:hypothetical protein